MWQRNEWMKSSGHILSHEVLVSISEVLDDC